MTPIREIDAIDRARFDADIRAAGQPVVIRGLAGHWPAVERAKAGDVALIDYLKGFAHDAPVNAIVGDPAIEGRFFYTPDLTALNFTRGKSPLAPFLDRLLRDRDEPRPYAMAVQSILADDLLPGFAGDHGIDLVDRSVAPRLWLGNAIRVATHYDLMENIAVVVAGRRRFTVFPPDQIANLYIGPFDLTPAGTPVSMVDPDAPDLTRFPRFREAQAAAQQTTLEPGDALYIPFHWWHAVASLDAVNVLCNYWWNSAAPPVVSPYDALLVARFAMQGAPDDQRAAWRAMFDHLVFHAAGDPLAHLPEEARGLLGSNDRAAFAGLRASLLDKLGRP